MDGCVQSIFQVLLPCGEHSTSISLARSILTPQLVYCEGRVMSYFAAIMETIFFLFWTNHIFKIVKLGFWIYCIA